MILAAQQPNYIPWIGYFNKIFLCDVFVVLDEVKFVKDSVIQRNKIKNSQSQELRLTIPVLKGNTKIKEICIDNRQNWRRKHWKSIFYSYSKCKNWGFIGYDLEEIYKRDWNNLCDLNMEIIKLILEKLNIRTKIIFESEIKGDLGFKNERLINLCKSFNADTYLSGIGAKAYNDEDMYNKENIKLAYQDFTPPIYIQKHNNFIPNLSIIDLLFNEGRNSIDIVKKSGEIKYTTQVDELS
ncbi:WbqC family protein [Oceanirhabdus sp. W0125-5]|uniref:WbqC family protein n=1 Tax=Oceanirhabdus sp. W0125-5 TaxID=2999116 RepID=UPI0022F2FD70|nr:WbqC family protein [Oceanirhabdus sp. W0125-5]WBW96615.1 WbqC family protein [Oceanirhabdus sp. W0125-5]